jgi:cytochrome c biogenesis protein CcmG, thiol:disulfide interchange protein DsbE
LLDKKTEYDPGNQVNTVVWFLGQGRENSHPVHGIGMRVPPFKNKPVVLNFWASWCAPCQEEMPLLERNWEQAQAQGKDVVFLGVDFQEAGSAAASFLQLHRITYPIVLDADGAVALKYDVTALLQTIFINRHGTVVSRIPGELTSQTFSRGLQMSMEP